MKLPEKSKALQIIEGYCEAYKNRDLPTILNSFTKNCTLWGTGIDEYRVGLQEVEAQHLRDFSQSDRGEIQILSSVPTPLDALWTAVVCKALITINGMEHVFDHLRGTIVISKENGLWKISHMHASFPDFRNPQNNSFPANN